MNELARGVEKPQNKVGFQRDQNNAKTATGEAARKKEGAWFGGKPWKAPGPKTGGKGGMRM